MLVAVIAVGFTAPGANFAVREITRLVSSDNLKIEIGTVSAPLTGHFTLDHAVISDSAGPWLTLDNAVLDWSPLALLRGRFSAASLTAGNIALDRLPQSGESDDAPKTDAGGGFSLPIGIWIDHFDFAAIDIDEKVLGEKFPISVSGHLGIVADQISAVIDAEHRAKPSTYVKADLEYAPKDDALTLKAEVNEPEGGMVAALLRIPGEPALNIGVDGTGPLSDWSGSLNATLAGSKLGEIDFTHKLAADGTRAITASGTGSFSTLIPETFRSLFAGTTDLDVAVAMTSDGRITINKGDVGTGAFQLAASGSYDPNGSNDLKASLTGTLGPVPLDLPLGEDTLAIRLASADLSLSGDASKAVIKADATLASLDMAQLSIGNAALTASADSFNLTDLEGSVSTALSVGSIDLKEDNLNRLLQAPVKITAPVTLTGNTVTVAPLSIESSSIGGTVTADYDRKGGTVKGDAKLFVLASALPSLADGKIDGMTKLSAHYQADLTGNVSLSGLSLENNLLGVSGDVALEKGDLDAKLTADITDIAALAPQVKGGLSLSLQASGAVAKPDIDLTATAKSLAVNGLAVSDLAAAIKGTADIKAPKASLTVNASYAGQPLSVAANVTSSNGVISISDIAGKVDRNTVSGAVTLDADYNPKGQIAFDLPDLAPLAALAGQDASGDLSGNATFGRANDALSLAVKASSGTLAYGANRLSKTAIDLTVRDLAELDASGTVTIGSILAAGQSISSLKLEADNAGSKTNLVLGATYDNAPVNVEAAVTRGATLEVDVTRLEAAPMALAVKLQKPSHVSIDGGKITIGDTVIGIGGGTITASGALGKTLNAKLAINAVSAALANQFVPSLGAAGTISGTVTASGSLAAPNVKYAIKLDGGSVAQTRNLGLTAIAIDTSGSFDGKSVTTNTQVSGGGITLAATGSVGLSAGTPLDLQVNGSIPMASVAGVAASSGFAIAGKSDVNVKIGGTATQPAINGAIEIGIPSFTDIRRNLSMNNLNGRITFAGSTATIENLKGNFSGGGSIAIGGTLGLTDPFPADISVTFDNAVVNDNTLVAATLNGSLAIKGPVLQSPVLTGHITIPRAAITIPDRLPSSISEINIVHEDASAAILAQAREIEPSEPGGAQTNIGLNIVVDAPRAIFIRGRGIDAELGGRVTIAGTAKDPLVSGSFNLVRGRLTVLTRRLDFDSTSSLTFGGSLIPIINLQATTSVSSTTITIEITGLANDPKIELSSSPSLPQDEILSELIFARDSSSLSPLQIAQLADALAQLTGGTHHSIFETLRNGLGIDNLDLTTDSEGNTAVSVGKYLNDNTYIEVEQSRDTGTKASVNIDIGRNFTVKGSADSRGETTGGIFYEREY
ncbi:translocation/assembly module TamB domain-containing protein [Martelella sp. HB161492]|uniref:translocation/assembly module TamB domain-containing protein n=1 Tax=Martelella sp. HB161492 TaxID=2720726 RepID=UPI00158FDFB6